MDEYAYILGIMGAAIIIPIILLIALYVWESLIEYRILQMLNYDKPWFAWIPYARGYALVDIIPTPNGSDEIVYDGRGSFRINKKLMQFMWAIALCVSFIPNVGGWLSGLCTLFYMIPVYIFIFSTFEKKDPADSLAMGIISAIIGIVGLIMMTIDMRKARDNNIDLFNNNPYVYSINSAPGNGGYAQGGYNGGYGQPQGGYNGGFGQPQGGYNGGFGQPQGGFNGNPNMYGNPAGQNMNYGQPQQNGFGGQQTYGQAPQNYGAPQQNGFGGQQTYGQAPQQNYSQPQQAPQQDMFGGQAPQQNDNGQNPFEGQ